MPLARAVIVIAICPFELESPLDDGTCGCQPGTQGIAGGGCSPCNPGLYSPLVGNEGCLPCDDAHTTSAAGADMASACVCEDGYYRDTGSVNAPCRACPEEAACAFRSRGNAAQQPRNGNTTQQLNNATLSTLVLAPGNWRLSRLTNDIRSCGGQACLGGPEPGDGSCANGTKGPLCRVCALPWHYPRDSGGASDGCLECSVHGTAAVARSAALVLAAIAVVVLLAGSALRCQRSMEADGGGGGGLLSKSSAANRFATSCANCMFTVRSAAERHGFVGKLKTVITYFQIVVAMPEV